jgi:protein arginine N-methyltransferase 5
MLIHGFAGYFDCCLYKDVHVSILPRNHTPEMSSWFPIYFPIRDPYYWKAGTTLKATFWRHATKQKVWYEWCITDPNQTAIHNPNGRSYFIGLY